MRRVVEAMAHWKRHLDRRQSWVDTETIDPATSMSLRSHRANQLKKRVALGPDWKVTDLVFTQEDGSAVHPQGFEADG